MQKKIVPSAHLIIFCIVSCALIGGAGSAWATLKNNFQPEPKKIGGFLVSPSLKLQQLYTNNVLASPNNEKDDLVTALAPELSIHKKIRDHEFQLQASTQIKKHFRNHNENTIDGHASLSGLLIARRSLKIPVSFSFDRLHIARDEETAQISPQKPTRIHGIRTEGGFIYEPNRLRIELMGRYAQKRYDDGLSASNVQIIRSDDDADETSVTTKVSYNTHAGWSPFLKFKAQQTNFLHRSHNGVSFDGRSRDYSYSSALVGIGFDKNTLSGHIAAGYNNLRYDAATLRDSNAFQLSANLDWQPIERGNINLNLARVSKEDSIVESAYIKNAANLALGYELKKDLFLNATTALKHNAYESGRDDLIYQGQVGMDYILKPAIQAHANITSRKRDSDESNEDYLQNIFMLGVTGNL